MFTIQRIGEKDAETLSAIAIPSFIQSHGHSAPAADITNYVSEKYNARALAQELADPANIFHIVCVDNKPAGYSKIILNHAYEGATQTNLTKLERIYVLEEFLDQGTGKALFAFNKQVALAERQSGIWLYVWKENHRAIRFYKKNGFTEVGEYDFRISPTHSNPNHIMLLTL